MKYLYALFIVLLTSFSVSYSQTKGVRGIVLTDGYAPLEGASVAVVNVEGETTKTALTDSLGCFSLAMDDDVKTEKSVLAVSYVGYEKYQGAIENEDMGIIVLHANSNSLQEVTVSGVAPAYTTNGSTLVANVQNSILKDAGSAMDVLKQLPLVSIKDNQVTVFGKGSTLVFVNDREIHNLGELQKLHSRNIKKIDIITNPGVQYSASAEAVIKIYTKQRAEGFSLFANAYAQKGEKWNELFMANMSYAGERFALFADYAIQDLRVKQDQLTSVAINRTSQSLVLSEDHLNLKRKQHNFSFGTEYKLSEKSTIGVKYDQSFLASASYNVLGTIAAYSASEITADYLQQSFYKPKGHDSNVNVFYNGKDIKGWNLAFNTDYTFGSTKTAAKYDDTETMTAASATTNSNSDNDYRLWSTRLELSRTIGKSSLSMSADYSNTHNETSYSNDNADLQEDLPSTNTLNKQNQLGLSLNYGLTLGSLNLQAGLRYEWVDQNYDINGEKQEDQCKTYSNLFPSVSVSNMFGNKLSMTLSYRRTVNRPSYYQLRGDVQYNSPFSYEAGNPLLKNTYVDNLSYTASYSNLSVFFTYKIYHDRVLFAINQFEDKPITMSTFTNIDDFKKLSLSAVWSPTFFKIWSPRMEAGVEKQFLKVEDGESRSYNQPYCYVGLYNVLNLPSNISFVVNAKYWSFYHSDLSYCKEAMYVSASVQKPFLGNALVLRLGAENIFNTNNEKWTMSYKNIDYMKKAHADNRFAYISLVYSFHKAKRYTGKGARSSEQNRLNRL